MPIVPKGWMKSYRWSLCLYCLLVLAQGCGSEKGNGDKTFNVDTEITTLLQGVAPLTSRLESVEQGSGPNITEAQLSNEDVASFMVKVIKEVQTAHWKVAHEVFREAPPNEFSNLESPFHFDGEISGSLTASYEGKNLDYEDQLHHHKNSYQNYSDQYADIVGEGTTELIQKGMIYRNRKVHIFGALKISQGRDTNGAPSGVGAKVVFDFYKDADCVLVECVNDVNGSAIVQSDTDKYLCTFYLEGPGAPAESVRCSASN